PQSLIVRADLILIRGGHGILIQRHGGLGGFTLLDLVVDGLAQVGQRAGDGILHDIKGGRAGGAEVFLPEVGRLLTDGRGAVSELSGVLGGIVGIAGLAAATALAALAVGTKACRPPTAACELLAVTGLAGLSTVLGLAGLAATTTGLTAATGLATTTVLTGLV